MTRQRIIDDGDKILELFLHGGYDLEQLYRQYTDPNGEPDNYETVIKKSMITSILKQVCT